MAGVGAVQFDRQPCQHTMRCASFCYLLVLLSYIIHGVYPSAGPAQEAAASSSGPGILQGELCQRIVSWLDAACCICHTCHGSRACNAQSLSTRVSVAPQGEDLYMFDDFQTSKQAEPRRPPCECVHCNLRY